MLAILTASIVLVVGFDRVHPVLLAALCIASMVACDPALLAATFSAYLMAFGVLVAALTYVYPVALHGVQPGRWVLVTPRLAVAVVYA